MPGRVFISCGQRTRKEKNVATRVKEWFVARGFKPYVAIDAQSLVDVNSGIIGELKRSDFYVFIDFRRERLLPRVLSSHVRRKRYRGSLFTNQELAISCLLGFEHAVFLQQEGIEREGLLQFMGANARRFAKPHEVPALVQQLVDDRGWQSSYTRHLELGETHWTPPLTYVDHTGEKHVRVLQFDVHNRRRDLGALDATCRLQQITANGVVRKDVDRSPLKATGQPGYTQMIWPTSHAAWDLLAVHLDKPPWISLNSALDVPRQPIISEVGSYELRYEIFAENFPVLTFEVRLEVDQNPMRTKATVRSDVDDAVDTKSSHLCGGGA